MDRVEGKHTVSEAGLPLYNSSHLYYDSAARTYPWAQIYVAGNSVNGKAMLGEWMDATWTGLTRQGIAVWIGETGFLTSAPYWEEEMRDQIALFEERGLGYALYTYGATRWRDPYDIVQPDALYKLTTVGGIYRELLKTYSLQ